MVAYCLVVDCACAPTASDKTKTAHERRNESLKYFHNDSYNLTFHASIKAEGQMSTENSRFFSFNYRVAKRPLPEAFSISLCPTKSR